MAKYEYLELRQMQCVDLYTKIRMTEKEISAIIFGCFISLLVLGIMLYIIILTIKEKIYNNKYKHIKNIINKYDKKICIPLQQKDNELYQIEKEIDTLFENLKYSPKDEEEKIQRQIDELKEKHLQTEKKLKDLQQLNADWKQVISKIILDTNDKGYIKYNKELGWVKEKEDKTLDK